MRCTECSKPVSPIVAVDIDGVLGDYHGHIKKFAEEYLGRHLPGPNFDGMEAHREWYLRRGVSNAEFRDIKLAYRQGGMKRSMPANFDMALLTARLRMLKVEVWITTTRPYLRLDNVDPDTRHFLERNHVSFDHLMYDEHKYIRLAEYVDKDRVVAIIDDEAEMYDEAAKTFGPDVPYLFMSGHNYRVTRPQMLLTPQEAADTIVQRVRQWRTKNV